MRNQVFALVVLATLVVSPAGLAYAQETEVEASADPYTRWNGVRDRFVAQIGGYFVTHSTFTRLQPRGLPDIPGVDLERDISIPESTTDFRLDGYVRFGNRHRLRVGWWQMDRDVVKTLTARLEWGDEVYEASTDISARWDTQVIKAEYRYSLFQGARFDVGAALGFFIMDVETGVGIAGSDRLASNDTRRTAPLPMLGLDVEYELARRWLLRGSGQYFAIALDQALDGKWWEARAAVEFVPLKNFGLGLGYNFASIDLDIALDEGRIARFEYDYQFNGPHVYLVASF